VCAAYTLRMVQKNGMRSRIFLDLGNRIFVKVLCVGDLFVLYRKSRWIRKRAREKK